MKTLTISLIMLSIFLMGFLSLGVAVGESRTELLRAAEKGLEKNIEELGPENIVSAGLVKDVDEKEYKFAEPLQVSFITPDKVLAYDGKGDLEDVITPTNLWYFPVEHKGEVRCLLMVDYFKGEWQAVSIGNIEMAKEVEGINKLYKAKYVSMPRLIKVLKPNCNFLSYVGQDNESSLIPLGTTAKILGLAEDSDSKSKSYLFNQIMLKLGGVFNK